MKRKLIAILTVSSLLFTMFMASCSKCYNCQSVITKKDQNGNIIGYDTTKEDVCTADKSEIQARENQGAKCTAT